MASDSGDGLLYLSRRGFRFFLGGSAEVQYIGNQPIHTSKEVSNLASHTYMYIHVALLHMGLPYVA